MIRTDLIVVDVWVLRLHKRMMVLTVENEGIGWPGDLGFLRCLNFRIASSWDGGNMSVFIMRRHDLDHPTIRVFEGRHRSLDKVAR